MDDTEVDDHLEEDGIEDNSYQACYIFRSGGSHDTGANQRPNKKRKLNNSTSSATEVARLSDINSSDESIAWRQRLLEQFWEQQQAKFGSDEVDHDNVTRLSSFISSTRSLADDNSLKTALLLIGLDGANYSAVLQQLHATLEESITTVLVDIQSRQCPNLQVALKNIIKSVIVEHADSDMYNAFLAQHKRLLPLSFDLELLELYVQRHSITRIVISLADIETFDSQVSNEIVSTLYLWRKRIPFALMLAITSTKELFEHRLSKSCLKLIDARAFSFKPRSEPHITLLRQAQKADGRSPQVFLGPSIVSTICEIGQAQGRTARSVESTLQYIYMSHFFANPLAVLTELDTSSCSGKSMRHLAQAVRNTESFRAYCEALLSDKDRSATAIVRKLLNDDQSLLQEAQRRVRDGQTAYSAACQVVHGFADLCYALPQGDLKKRKSKIEIESQLYHAIEDLVDTTAYDEVEAFIHGTSSVEVLVMVRALDTEAVSVLGLEAAIEALQQEVSEETGSIGVHSNVTMNFVAQTNSTTAPLPDPSTPRKRGKVSKAATPRSRTPKKTSAQISSAKENLLSVLKQKLSLASLDISSLFLHEAYILSARATRFRQNFEPQPRTTVERALLRPADYLSWHQGSSREDDESDGDDSTEPSKTQSTYLPPASILFTLLQEAPTIINVRDLFDAFQSRLDPASHIDGMDLDDDQVDGKANMTQFYRALAELKITGLVRASTGTQIKRATKGKNAKTGTQDIDFVAKTSWAGL